MKSIRLDSNDEFKPLKPIYPRVKNMESGSVIYTYQYRNPTDTDEGDTDTIRIGFIFFKEPFQIETNRIGFFIKPILIVVI